jgi:hypothetical protein
VHITIAASRTTPALVFQLSLTDILHFKRFLKWFKNRHTSNKISATSILQPSFFYIFLLPPALCFSCSFPLWVASFLPNSSSDSHHKFPVFIFLPTVFSLYIVTCLPRTWTAKPSETVVALERLCKHARCYTVTQWMSHDGSHAYRPNNRRTVGSFIFCVVRRNGHVTVFCEVRPKAISAELKGDNANGIWR